MGLNIGVTETPITWNDNQDWLGSQHGTKNADNATLDGVAFRAVFADGVVPSGCPIARLAATGRYIPGVAGALAAGTDKPGHLLHTVQVPAAGNAVGARFWHGEVVIGNLPPAPAPQLDADGRAARRLIEYV